MESRHVSKAIDVFQINSSCLLDTWRKKHQVPITSLSLHWAIHLHNPVYMFAGQGSSSSEHAKSTKSLYYFVYLPSNYSMTFPFFTALLKEVNSTFVEIHKKLLLSLSSQQFWQKRVASSQTILSTSLTTTGHMKIWMLFIDFLFLFCVR